MRRRRPVASLVAFGLIWSSLLDTVAAQPLPEVIAEVRIHGNQSLSDAEIVALAGVTPGDPAGPDLVAEIERRLEESGRFETFEVRKRYRSLTASEQVSLILVVRERAAATSSNPIARSFGEIGRRTLFLPVLDYTEGYAVTYGARATFVDIAGADGRLSIPATWGGTKRIALELDKPFERGLVHRVRAGVSLSRRENPRFEVDDDRRQVWMSVDRRLPAGVRAEAHAAWAAVGFGTRDERLAAYRVQLELDTRVDGAFPRDAVLASAGMEWLDVATAGIIVTRAHYEASGFKGLWGQTVFLLRTRFVGANGPVPPYEQSLIGGGLMLRGWRLGDFIGDQAFSASAELRFPMSSPLSIGRAGFSLFYDTAAAYAYDQVLADQRLYKGTGVGVFLRAPLVHLQIDVAHNLVDRMRLHVMAALTF